jgi:signal transduction histidine kinase
MTIKNDPPLVLIADDQIPTTVMLERIFEHEGYQVKSVYDGIEAMDAAQKLLPDLILLDINMPGMNGLEVLRLLRENSITTNIPTILITAKGEPADIAHGLSLGADDYIPKPFHPRELLARAQSKMKARRLEEALQRRTRELEALLRAGEELTQHLEIEQLLDLILFLALDLLPSNLAVIYRIDGEQQIVSFRVQSRNLNESGVVDLPHEKVVHAVVNEHSTILWPDDAVLVEGFSSGMATRLQHGTDIHGVLLLCAYDEFDSNHFRLFNGIARQATLALRNAELYAIQADYALHLEDMVAARTEELESAHRLLVRAEKLASVGRLAASIAHEINNPLLPIRINLEHMLEDVEHHAAIDPEDIKVTQERVERISRIVKQLLQFTGKRTADGSDLEQLDVTEIIDDIVDLNRKYFQQEGMIIEVDLSPLSPIYGNKDQLEQVFMNLALNARAAMKSGGRLKIRAGVHESHVVVEFEDTGCGIAPEMIESIFEPFVSTKEDGTGLGLFISYGIIQNHRGSIEVKSKVNVGSTFTVKLPLK